MTYNSPCVNYVLLLFNTCALSLVSHCIF